jgi:hypothetical protein
MYLDHFINMKDKKMAKKNVNIIGIWLLDAALVQHFIY